METKHPIPAVIYLAHARANDALQQIEAESIHLANFSPRYWNRLDYEKMAANPSGRWERTDESLLDYLAEHTITCRLLWEVMAPDSVVAVEIDDIRNEKEKDLVLLSDYWRAMLQDAGFRILEVITLGREIAAGKKIRRSNHFFDRKDQKRERAGFLLPDNVTSDLVIAAKGDPLDRLRTQGRDEADRIDRAWAERFLRNLWMIPPFKRRQGGHACPQHWEVARAVIAFYSLQGDRILDCYAGEGTTGTQASALGRDAILVEAVKTYADALRARFGATLPLDALSTRTSVHDVQLYLPLPAQLDRIAKRAFYRSARSEVTQNFEAMARLMTREIGLEVSPHLIGIFHRIERQFYREGRAA